MKVLLWVIGVPLAIFAMMVIYQLIDNHMLPDQSFAASSGLSMSECIKFSTTLGSTQHEARQMCEKRVPRK